jgi:DNA polymerase-3 subunit gamma/tau
MENFVVSARKYRPQTFDTVVGQEHITTTLKNAIRNQQLAHAFLFCGPRGVGKTTCARILAKTINCENPTENQEACDQCPSCMAFNNGSSLNIHELDAASNNGVEDIRELVEQVRYLPQSGKYKVYIIDEVHMLTAQAFNAFLKTLEEPPSYAIFILATTEKHKIIPTILSRCQIFDFKRITINDTVEHLESICKKENIKADKAALQVIAQKSDGCMRDALSLMDTITSFTNGHLEYSSTLEHLNILDEEYYFRLLDLMQQQNLPEVLLIFNEINRKGFEGDILLNGFAEFFRNLLVSYDKKSLELLDVVEGFKPRYAEAAAKTDPGFVLSALNILNEGEIQYKTARNKRLHVELVLIKLTYLNQAVQLATDDSNIVSKKKLTESSRPVMFRSLPMVEKKSIKPSPPPEANKPIVKENPLPEAPLPLKKEANPAAQPEMPVVNEPVPSIKVPEPPAVEIKAKPISAAMPSPGEGRKNIINLNNIRNEIKQKLASSEEAIPLHQELLKEVWTEMLSRLKEENHHAHISFASATLEIEDGNMLRIIGDTHWDMKVMEGERRRIAEVIQQKFRNRSILLEFDFREQQHPEDEKNRPLTRKEQYQLMVEKYPMIKELKDRLGLEVDY